MERKIFFNKIKEDFFEKLECSFEGFKDMVCGAMPVFGKLETDIIELQTGKIIIFRDIDHAMFTIAPEGYEPTEEDLDMSGTIMTLTLDTENEIKTVEHGVRLFTPANKEAVLFLSSIIGKRIIF
jgi:hypothetical protein